nr:MAG TPA: tail tube protein [Caudoviricetes sp.]
MAGNTAAATPAVKNRFHSKLKAMYYAPATITETAGTKSITYGKPVRMFDAVALSLSKKGDLIVVRSDGMEDVIGSDNQGYDGEAELLRLPESFEKDCLSSTVNADGTVDEFEKDDAKPFALLFEFLGDKKNVRHCLYWCYANRPNVEGDNPDNKEPKNEKTTIYARPRPTDGKIKTKTGDSITDTVYNAWYTAVPDQTSSGS